MRNKLRPYFSTNPCDVYLIFAGEAYPHFKEKGFVLNHWAKSRANTTAFLWGSDAVTFNSSILNIAVNGLREMSVLDKTEKESDIKKVN